MNKLCSKNSNAEFEALSNTTSVWYPKFDVAGDVFLYFLTLTQRDLTRQRRQKKRTLRDVIWCHFETTSRKQTERRFQFSCTTKCIDKKGDFIRLVCVKIAAAVDKINKMAGSRLEGKQCVFASFFE